MTRRRKRKKKERQLQSVMRYMQTQKRKAIAKRYVLHANAVTQFTPKLKIITRSFREPIQV